MNTPAMPPKNPDKTLKTLLGGESTSLFSRRWPWIAGVALILIAAIIFVAFRSGKQGTEPQYATEVAALGSLVVKVSATGQLEPTNQVDVGSELSGTVARVFVDDDDRVTKGEVLAQLDLSKFEDSVAKSRAAVAVAEASLQQASATQAETRAKLDRYREVSRLSGGKVPSKTEIETATAELARADANAASARANIIEARAALHTDEINLGKASIRSPTNGVVLKRAVDPGQTVAASLQAVTLFTLAEDLTKMELKADVDEADVGQVKAGLKATFTVDAWPGRQFEAVITRVGFNATNTEGVISYPAVLRVANDDLSLRPGMTGTAEITTATRENVLLVPNAALRFTPATTITAQKKSSGSIMRALIPRPPRQAPKAQSANIGAPRVWVLRDGRPVAVDVKTGVTNGRMTEIIGGALKAGMPVITETLGTAP